MPSEFTLEKTIDLDSNPNPQAQWLRAAIENDDSPRQLLLTASLPRREEMEDDTPRAVREEVERAFEQAQENPALVKDLGALLQRHGVFDRYQDRFFKLVRRG